MIIFDDTKIFIYSKAIDMRKGIDGLCQLLVKEEIKPQAGGLYLFSNRTGRVIKGLIWDRNGFILIYKRIESGRFKVKFDHCQKATLALTHEQLKWLLAGHDYERLMLFPELNIQYFY